jgi:hypothetical protein
MHTAADSMCGKLDLLGGGVALCRLGPAVPCQPDIAAASMSAPGRLQQQEVVSGVNACEPALHQGACTGPALAIHCVWLLL